jgi:hypothetical protein
MIVETECDGPLDLVINDASHVGRSREFRMSGDVDDP